MCTLTKLRIPVQIYSSSNAWYQAPCFLQKRPFLQLHCVAALAPSEILNLVDNKGLQECCRITRTSSRRQEVLTMSSQLVRLLQETQQVDGNTMWKRQQSANRNRRFLRTYAVCFCYFYPLRRVPLRRQATSIAQGSFVGSRPLWPQRPWPQENRDTDSNKRPHKTWSFQWQRKNLTWSWMLGQVRSMQGRTCVVSTNHHKSLK